MWNPDSVDKIITVYFSSITKTSFEYKGKTYNPVPLKVSPKVVRGFKCPANCGGCCMVASIDWLPNEVMPENYPHIEKRMVEFNGSSYLVYSDQQKDNDGSKCRNVDWSNGRCQIHDSHALSCDFECLKFFQSKTGKPNRLTNMPFPRKWSYTRVDGGKGGLCESLPVTKESMEDVLRRLRRLEMWANYFEVDHFLDEVIEWVEGGPHNEPAMFNISWSDSTDTANELLFTS